MSYLLSVFKNLTISRSQKEIYTDRLESHRMKETALITGASSGIGLELAREAAKDGCNLILVARSVDKLEALAKEVGGTVIPADLSQKGACLKLAEEVKSRGLTVDILINNAGFATYGPLEETDRQTTLDMIEVNVTSLTDLTHLFLPQMLERKHGRIMNLASTAAFQPGPLMCVYYATKAYVLSFSEGLSNEVRPKGVSVTALCPGVTESGFQAAARMEHSKLVQGRMPTSAEVARYGWKAMKAGQVVAIPGARNWIMATAVRFLPRSIIRRIVQKAQEARA